MSRGVFEVRFGGGGFYPHFLSSPRFTEMSIATSTYEKDSTFCLFFPFLSFFYPLFCSHLENKIRCTNLVGGCPLNTPLCLTISIDLPDLYSFQCSKIKTLCWDSKLSINQAYPSTHNTKNNQHLSHNDVFLLACSSLQVCQSYFNPKIN